MMLKKVFSLLLLSSSLFIQSHLRANPDKKVLAFDYHGVVVYLPLSEVVKQCGGLIAHASNKLRLIALALNPRFWYDVITIKKEVDVTDVLLKRLAERYPALAPHIPRILEITNIHEPIEGTVAVLKELKAKGYAIYLASNIGSDSLQRQRARHAQIFKLFSRCYNATDRHGKKPEPAFYKGLKQFLAHDGQGNKSVVFVDDRKKNVVGAEQNGIEGIHFTSSKQLREELVKREILPEKEEE